MVKKDTAWSAYDKSVLLLQLQIALVSFFVYYTPRKLCLWWVYCFHVVRACVRVCASVRPSVRNVLFF